MFAEFDQRPGCCISRPWDNTVITVKKIELFDHVGAPLAHTATATATAARLYGAMGMAA